jgi:hypothetical protein
MPSPAFVAVTTQATVALVIVMCAPPFELVHPPDTANVTAPLPLPPVVPAVKLLASVALGGTLTTNGT